MYLYAEYNISRVGIDNNMVEDRHSMLAELVSCHEAEKPSAAPVISMPPKPEYEQMVLPFA